MAFIGWLVGNDLQFLVNFDVANYNLLEKRNHLASYDPPDDLLTLTADS